jgi:hypothetical protein
MSHAAIWADTERREAAWRSESMPLCMAPALIRGPESAVKRMQRLLDR